MAYKDCIISCIIRKKGMAICFETFPLTVETSRKLLELIDEHMYDTFFSSDGLAKLGWCANYHMESRIAHNKNTKNKFEKVQIVEIYWFNVQKLDHFNQKICECFHCYCFKKSK